MEPMTPEQIKRLLQRYYDIPQMIDEELATIRHCQEERGKFSIASPNLSGMPTGKGSTGDPTAAQAMRDSGAYFDRQIAVCQKRIAHLQEQRDWCRVALGTLGRAERRILELAYMGPKEPQARRKWTRRPPWKEICAEVGFSDAECDGGWARKKASALLHELSELSPQEVLSWSS
jgi:hypothetical protein